MSLMRKIFFSLAGISIFVFLMLIVFGDRGYSDLRKIRKERDRIIEKNVGIEKENILLYRTIKRLKHDPKYIGEIARKELGMVGRDEMIFKFNNKRSENE